MKQLKEVRCNKCNLLLAKISNNGTLEIQIKCRKCKTLKHETHQHKAG